MATGCCSPHSFPNGIHGGAGRRRFWPAIVWGAEQAVQRLVKVPLTQGQFDALVDFCFNLGAGKLATSTLLKELNCRRYEDAARTVAALGPCRIGQENATA
jgi:lysozyme